MQPISNDALPLIECNNLTKHFLLSQGPFEKPRVLRAVQDITLRIRRGETVGLVGESGCGKSTLGRTLLMLLAPTSGDIIMDGCNLARLREREIRPWRRRMQIVFQDPYSSLDPRMTVEQIIGEPLLIHRIGKSASERRAIIVDLLGQVGLHSDCMSRYAHEFSGGQRQRVGIARAIAVKPEFIVCDEPLSALDVSIQAQIVNLLLELREKLGMSYLFISHDLEIVRFLSKRIAVMYLGRIVEVGTAEEVATRPYHPYTQALLNSIPVANPKQRRNLELLSGDVPNPTEPPPGCAFHPRCPRAIRGTCDRELPLLEQSGHDHSVACFNPIDHAGA